MKKKISIKIFILCCLFGLWGCSRTDSLCYEGDHPHTQTRRITFTTTYTGLFEGDDAQPDAPVRVYIYSEDGQLLPLQIHANTLELAPGTYRALATNVHDTDVLPVGGTHAPEQIYAAISPVPGSRSDGSEALHPGSRSDGTLYQHASNLYASGVIDFTVDPQGEPGPPASGAQGELGSGALPAQGELGTGTLPAGSGPIFTLGQRAAYLRLIITVNRPELITSLSGTLHGMATQINLSSGTPSGSCSVQPVVSATGATTYLMEAIILGGAPDVRQTIEINAGLVDGSTHNETKDLTDQFLTIDYINSNVDLDVYITIDPKLQPDGTITITSEIDGWIVGDEVHGTIKN